MEKGGVFMKNLFYYADKYLEKSVWKDLAMIKFCLFSIGILAGIKIPAKNKKKAGMVASVLFAITYIPLMAKFFAVIAEKDA